MNHTPPRLLAGAILLVWGGLTGHSTWGLIGALLLEARSWTGLRWNFNRGSYIKAWQFSILIGALIAMLAWVNGIKVGKLHTLFVWAPMALLPLELAQRYGRSSQIPLNTFSFFARKKMDRDIAQGRSISPRMINTGYLYIAIVILATAMASRNDLQHFIGLSLMTSACLFFYVRKSGFRPWAWSAALLITLALTFIGQWGMFKLYHYFTGTRGEGHGQHTSTNESRTSIGKLGRLKLSPKIFWRMTVHEGNVPKLLRTATYNQYSRTRWTHDFNPPPEGSERDEFDYIEDTDISLTPDRDIRLFLDEPSLKLTGKGNVSIIGEVDSGVIENPIPLPHHTLAIGDLGKEADIGSNSLGTVRITNPENHVINYTVWIGETSTNEENPINKFDRHIPSQEKDAIARIAQQLGLKEPGLSTRAKIRKLRHFFTTEFQYSTHLKTPRVERGKRQSAIGIFLETTRSGHCEYFATATALLLREAGVPTRYCVGFSVHEKDTDNNEWVMRGQHAHAWCRVWIEEQNSQGETIAQWEDIDLTPSAWHSMDTAGKADWQRKLADWWQRLREDFLIWRTKEANKTKVAVIVAIIVTLLLLWIGWRLWHSRQRKVRKARRMYQRPENTPVTALHKLEPLIAKRIGPRPNGTPLCQWMLDLIQTEPSLKTDLKRMTELHSRLRFDPIASPIEDTDELNKLALKTRRFLKTKPKR